MRVQSSFLEIETKLGIIGIELDCANAPLTSDYFIRLAGIGALDGTSFFRIATSTNNSYNPDIPIHVVQGGRMDDAPEVVPPIKHEPTNETGLSHKRWSVSMARYGIGETYGSFFIVMRNEPELDYGGGRHPDKQGFAVFGKVSTGKNIVEAMFLKAEENEFLTNRIQIVSARHTHQL